MTDSQRTAFPAFTEYRVQRDRGSLYARDFPGSGPAFVLLHGFPDNSHIYDDLVPHLTSAGRSARLGHTVPVSRHDVLREIRQRIADGIRLHRQLFDRNIEMIDPKSVISERFGTRGVPTAGRRKHDVLAR